MKRNTNDQHETNSQFVEFHTYEYLGTQIIEIVKFVDEIL